MTGEAFHFVQAFTASATGDFVADERLARPSAAAARALAERLAETRAGVVAWSQLIDPEMGGRGERTVLFQAGRTPADFR